MNWKKWDQFFELLDDIVNPKVSAVAPWQDRRDELKAEAEARDATTNLEEFIGWFDE
jgi:hypothetical protein